MLLKKVGIVKLLRNYWRNRVLLFALYQLFLNGFSRKGLHNASRAVSGKIYQKIRKNFSAFLENYVREHTGEICVQKSNPTIWTNWMQGMENAPEVVQKCYASMCKHVTNRPIVVITEKNLREYVTLPDYIMEKYKKGKISMAHFSDLVRLELLANYGGTWIDSTVYCSGEPYPSYVLNSELFLYQHVQSGPKGQTRSISNWLITADSGNPIILLTRALLYEYWKRYDYALDYFIFHNFLQMAIEAYPEVWNKVVPFSNVTPHLLQFHLFEQYDPQKWENLRKQTSFHKLTYKFNPKDVQRPGTYYKEILGK